MYVAKFNALKGGSTMNGNIFFEQNGRKMYGNQFGYAVEYKLVHELGIAHIRFEPMLSMPDDPQNWKRPKPTDLASEMLVKLRKTENELMASLYGIWLVINKEDTVYDIKKKIQQIQSSLIKIDSHLPADVKNHLQSGINKLIENMPIA